MADDQTLSATKIFGGRWRLSVISLGLLGVLVQQARTRCANFRQAYTYEFNTSG